MLTKLKNGFHSGAKWLGRISPYKQVWVGTLVICPIFGITCVLRRVFLSLLILERSYGARGLLNVLRAVQVGQEEDAIRK